jgi:ribosomal protein L22
MQKAIRAAKECGLTIHECVMTPKEVRLIFAEVDGSKAKEDTQQLKEWPR